MPRPCGESLLVKSKKDKEAVEHSGPREGEDEDFEFYPEREGVPGGLSAAGGHICKESLRLLWRIGSVRAGRRLEKQIQSFCNNSREDRRWLGPW